MFGFSFGELVILMIVAVVVIGPKELPKVLRKAGQWSAKLRRMASDIRVQSGIDDVLRGEGIAQDIAEIRKLARGELDNVTRAARVDLNAPHRLDPYVPAGVTPSVSGNDDLVVQRDREYPREGADSYRALPDTAITYASTLPKTPFARDALYLLGDADGILPPETPDAAETAEATEAAQADVKPAADAAPAPEPPQPDTPPEPTADASPDQPHHDA